MTLTHVAVDRETLYTRLALAMTDEASLPEVFVTYSYDVPYFVQLDYIQPMEDTLAAYPDFDFAIEKYHDACATLNYYDGVRYCVSLDFPTWGMYVNTALAEQYCPDVLADNILTWDEIMSVGASLKEQGVEDVSVLASSWDRNDLLNSYLDVAGTYASEDGTTLALDKDAVVEVLNTWKDAYDAGYLWEEGEDAMTMFALEECIFVTGGTVCIMLMTNGVNVWIALVCAVIAGMLAGLATGLFHTAMGIPPILAGILTQLSLYSINLAIMGGRANQAVSVTNYDLIVSSRYVRDVSVQNPIFITLIFIIALIAILYWFFGTELGCSLRATGANEAMSRAQGINTNLGKILGLMISNGIVALASALYSHYQGFVDVNMGRGAIVIGLAAVIISDVVFGRLFTNFALKLVAVAIGAVIYYIVIQVVLWLGLDTNLLKLLQALVVALFLAVPFWKTKLAAAKKGGKADA